MALIGSGSVNSECRLQNRSQITECFISAGREGEVKKLNGSFLTWPESCSSWLARNAEAAETLG